MFDPNYGSFPSDAFGPQQGMAEIRGVEIEGQARLGPLHVALNASRLDTENADGYRFASVPEDQASA